MVRFCDGDVGCVEYDLLSRGKLLSYFLNGHLEDMVGVYDSSSNYIGIITYHSLLQSVSVDAAICREYVVLDGDIWKNAREIFRTKSRNVRDFTLLPVLSRDHQLLCFAYQDEDANREIRMLRELQEIEGTLQFADVFPAYKCVEINGFNELAFLFAEYLQSQNIEIQVTGSMWQGFFESKECHVPEYDCLHIYAEGTWEKPRNWRENLLRSVSVEFECIDKIYDVNIKNKFINNVNIRYEELIECLREEKEVIICGVGIQAQDAYDFLVGNGVKVCCFVVEELTIGHMHRLFGKKILGLSEAIYMYGNPVFIECESKNSALGGRVDYYDYIGYKRNERFITLKDYISVQENILLNALCNTEVVLTGDYHLCSRLYEYLVQKNILVTGYLQTLETNEWPKKMPEVSEDRISQNVMCLIVAPTYLSHAGDRIVGMEEMNRCIDYLRKKDIDNYTDYFSEMISFINIECENDIKYKNKCFMPKKIVLGSIGARSGCYFFRSILDSHPSIIFMKEYHDLHSHLFWICVRLSIESADNILPLFWELLKGQEKIIVNRSAFVEKMEQLLAFSDSFTSQELFVMFHIAYMYMFGKNITPENIASMILYWEPHYLVRDRLEECVKWLGTEKVHCDIINIVRNPIPAKASTLKNIVVINEGVRSAYELTVLRRMPIDTKKYEYCDRLIVNFEDLKCNPRETLEKICGRWEMEWSDTLLQTTRNGTQDMYHNIMTDTIGFDLKPVYNVYENFFSEFDRMRLMIIDAPWRKKYGYPYVEPDQFTRKELQEMFLKEFRFENPGDTTGFFKNQLDLDERIKLQIGIRRRLQETRCLLGTWESTN